MSTEKMNSIGVMQINGIGPATQVKLANYEIYTAEDLVKMGDDWVELANLLKIKDPLKVAADANRLLAEQFHGQKKEKTIKEGFERMSKPMKRGLEGTTYRIIGVNHDEKTVQANRLHSGSESEVTDLKLAKTLYKNFFS